MKIRLAADLQPDSIVDGEGVRTVIWTQGCSHNCKGCHNPGTHDFNGGFEVDIEEIISEIKNLEGQEGITFSGGDPLFQSEACALIAKEAKECNLDIWCYTGPLLSQWIKKFQVRRLGIFWLGNRDSNPNKQSQSLSCYRYTIPQRRSILYPFKFQMSRDF